MKLEDTNVFRLDSIYEDVVLTAEGFNADFDNNGSMQYSLVLCDGFVQKRASGKKTGMPILYYKARAGLTFQDYQDAGVISDDVYNFMDNANILNLGVPDDSTIRHPLHPDAGIPNPNGFAAFENMILNTEVLPIRRPFRADSYILVSAGKDGLYGTSDDIVNFKRAE